MTIADGIAVRQPVPAAVHAMTQVVDDMVVVDDGALVEAMQLLWHALRVAVEPAGAAGIAALLTDPAIGHGLQIATPLCGANLTPAQARQWLLDTS